MSATINTIKATKVVFWNWFNTATKKVGEWCKNSDNIILGLCIAVLAIITINILRTIGFLGLLKVVIAALCIAVLLDLLGR